MITERVSGGSLFERIGDATLAYGDWDDRSRLADMGLYQGRRVGPYVEQTYLQLLEQRYLPALFNGLVKEMDAAPPESEEKLAVLRVMRMLEDKSGRNNDVVKQYMAKRWSDKFHGQRDTQVQLMSHLDYPVNRHSKPFSYALTRTAATLFLRPGRWRKLCLRRLTAGWENWQIRPGMW